MTYQNYDGPLKDADITLTCNENFLESLKMAEYPGLIFFQEQNTDAMQIYEKAEEDYLSSIGYTKRGFFEAMLEMNHDVLSLFGIDIIASEAHYARFVEEQKFPPLLLFVDEKEGVIAYRKPIALIAEEERRKND